MTKPVTEIKPTTQRLAAQHVLSECANTYLDSASDRHMPNNLARKSRFTKLFTKRSDQVNPTQGRRQGGGAKGAAAPSPTKKQKRRERGERKRERKKKEKRGIKRERKLK